MGRILLIALILVSCSLLALWSPWVGWKLDASKIFGVGNPDSISGLYLYSLSGTLELEIDGESMGSVSALDSPLIIDRIEPGQRLVSITRTSQNNSSYWSFSELIEFTTGTNVVISYNIGPTEEFSEGNIIYTKPKVNTNTNELTISLDTNDALVFLDDTPVQEINANTFKDKISLDSTHKLEISKPGFESFSFSVLPDTAVEREKLKDFDIFVNVRLLQIPVELEEV